jgi:hypothetical protein
MSVSPSKHLITTASIGGIGTYSSLNNLDSIDTISSSYTLAENKVIDTMGSVTVRTALPLLSGDQRLVTVELDSNVIFEDTCYAHVAWDNETLNANVQFTSAGLDDIDIGVAPEDYV